MKPRHSSSPSIGLWSASLAVALSFAALGTAAPVSWAEGAPLANSPLLPQRALEIGRRTLGGSGWKALKSFSLLEVRNLGPAKTLLESWPGNLMGGQTPQSGRKQEWKGVLLSDVIQSALDGMLVEERAQVDLIVLHSSTGDARALIPRALLKKFPFLMAWSREGRALGALTAIPPQSSQARIQAEGAPLESFFLENVGRIELASSRERFSSSILRRRTDPIAVRGEKVFLNSCLACHESGRAPLLTGAHPVSVAPASLPSGGEQVKSSPSHLTALDSKAFSPLHRTVKGTPALNDRDWQSLRSYWEAVRTEALEAGQSDAVRGASGAAAVVSQALPAG